MVESYSLFLLSISTAGIWSLAPSPGPRFLQGASHAMMRTQHFRIQNESTLHAICSNGSPNTDICFTASVPYPCPSSETMLWLLFIPNMFLKLSSDLRFIFIYCCFLDFQKVPLSHLSNAAHKFLYLWTQRASLSCRFPEQLLERRKGVDLGAMLNIKREPRTVVSSELNWDELTSSSTQFEWVKRSGVQNFWNCHLISTVTALVLSRNPTTLDEQMSAGVSKV